MEHESDFFGSVAKIALGIFVGGLLLWIAFEWRARIELRQVQQAVERAVHEADELARTSEQQRIEARARRAAEQAREQVRRLQAQQARRDWQADRQRANYQRGISVQATERVKADAWAKFYQPSAQCLANATVECGNQHMRAKKEFERRYAAGQL